MVQRDDLAGIEPGGVRRDGHRRLCASAPAYQSGGDEWQVTPHALSFCSETVLLPFDFANGYWIDIDNIVSDGM